MKTFIVLILAGILSIAVYAGQQSKSDAEYTRDEFITELIFKGVPKDEAERIVRQIHPDTLLIFMRLPDMPELNDSIGVPKARAQWRHITADGRKGMIVVTVRKSLIRAESNGGLGEEEWALIFKKIDIFDLTKGKK